MASIREFILNQSTLPTGNLVRDHIQNPGTGGGETVIISGAVEANVEEIEIDVSVVSTVDATVEVSDPVAANVVNVVAVDVKDENIEAGVCT